MPKETARQVSTEEVWSGLPNLFKTAFCGIIQAAGPLGVQAHLLHVAAKAMQQELEEVSTPIAEGMGKDARATLVAKMLAGEMSERSTRTDLDNVFAELRRLDHVAADTVLYHIHGMTVAEIAKRQQRPSWKVRLDIEFSMEWLADRVLPAQEEQSLMEERYDLLSEQFIAPLDAEKAARLEELELRLQEIDRHRADALDREYAETPAGRLDRGLAQLEDTLHALKKG